jgi:hypothetical protein
MASQVRINCRVTGRPAPEVNWFLKSGHLVQDDRHKMVINESGFHTLVIADTRMGDAGVIRCVAKNRSGVAEFQVEKRRKQGLTDGFFFPFPLLTFS